MRHLHIRFFFLLKALVHFRWNFRTGHRSVTGGTVTCFIEQENCEAPMRDFKAVTVANIQLETKIFSF